MFTSRINDLFQYLDAKNGQVAKLAGFDRTNISRLRSSGRTPEKNSPTIRKLFLFMKGILISRSFRTVFPWQSVVSNYCHACLNTQRKKSRIHPNYPIIQTDPALVIPSDLLPSACGKNLQAAGLLRIKAECQMLSFCYQIVPLGSGKLYFKPFPGKP